MGWDRKSTRMRLKTSESSNRPEPSCLRKPEATEHSPQHPPQESCRCQITTHHMSPRDSRRTTVREALLIVFTPQGSAALRIQYGTDLCLLHEVCHQSRSKSQGPRGAEPSHFPMAKQHLTHVKLLLRAPRYNKIKHRPLCTPACASRRTRCRTGGGP